MTMNSSRIPEIGTVPQAHRTFVIDWISNEWWAAGAPFLAPDFVARQGRHVRLLDLRTPDEMPGVLGYIPGVDWVPIENPGESPGENPGENPGEDPVDSFERWQKRLDPRSPLILISPSGHRAGLIAKRLSEAGFPLVAAMQGGMWHWRDLGFDTCHDRSLVPGRLRPLEVNWEPAKAVLTKDQVEAHLGDPLATRWLKLAALLVHGRLSCVDGRDATGVLGTPGGDAGEFVLALAALEHVTARTLDYATVAKLLARRMEVFGRFYVHSDVHAGNELIRSLRADPDPDLQGAISGLTETLQWRDFFRSPPKEVHGALLLHVLRSEHMGCGHLRLMCRNPAAYGVRSGLLLDVLRALYELRWQGSIEIEVTILPGGHAEGGVLVVMMEQGVSAFSFIPLVSPQAARSQLFISHPQVAEFLRDQLTEFLAAQHDLLGLRMGQAKDVKRVIAELGARQTGQTLSVLAKGLPTFEARFDEKRHFTVREI